MYWMAIGRTGLILLLSLFVIACSSPFADKNTALTLTIKAQVEVNPDDNGRPSPVYLNIYELRSGKNFSGIDYIALLQDPNAALGGDLVMRSRLDAMEPGADKQQQIILDPATQHIGVAAELIRYENVSSTLSFDIIPMENNEIVLMITKDGLKQHRKE